MGTKENVILKETMMPGSLAQSFDTTTKSYQAYNDEDNNEPEKIEESEDPNKLVERRAKKLHILYFNFVRTRKSLQEIYMKVKNKNFVAYHMHAPTEEQLALRHQPTGSRGPNQVFQTASTAYDEEEKFDKLMENFVECQPETANILHKQTSQNNILPAKAAKLALANFMKHMESKNEKTTKIDETVPLKLRTGGPPVW